MINHLYYRILVPSCILLIVLSTQCLSQSRDSHNAIYVEAFGAGILYSVNYERFVSKDFTFRIGFSLFPTNSNSGKDQSSLIFVPLIANFLLGEGNSKLEIGAGITYLVDNAESSGDISQASTTTQSSSGVVFVGSIGYRYQPSDGGLHFRLVATPLLSPYTGWFKLWFGSSIGFCF